MTSEHTVGGEVCGAFVWFTDMSNGRQRADLSSLGLTMTVYAGWTIRLAYCTMKRRERRAQRADMMVRSKYSSLIPRTLTPSMAISHRSRCPTAPVGSNTTTRSLSLAIHYSACQPAVTLSGETLHIEQDLAKALRWTPEHKTGGVSLRLSS